MAKFIPVEPEKWEKMVKAWAENVRLETENAQLEHVINYWKIEAETDNARWLRVLEENERLKAEVERLTKAGDAMASIIKYEPGVNTFDPVPDVVKRWYAAKGVQS
ncbi:MAG: hypothetical protein RIR91_2028 [Verrucomicrobiota bacterium]